MKDQALREVSSWLGEDLIRMKGKRSLFESVSGGTHIALTYHRGDASTYWFGYHNDWQSFFGARKKSWLALCCGTPNQILMIPHRLVESWVPSLEFTDRGAKGWWHILITTSSSMGWRRVGQTESLSKYAM